METTILSGETWQASLWPGDQGRMGWRRASSVVMCWEEHGIFSVGFLPWMNCWSLVMRSRESQARSHWITYNASWSAPCRLHAGWAQTGELFQMEGPQRDMIAKCSCSSENQRKERHSGTTSEIWIGLDGSISVLISWFEESYASYTGQCSCFWKIHIGYFGVAGLILKGFIMYVKITLKYFYF